MSIPLSATEQDEVLEFGPNNIDGEFTNSDLIEEVRLLRRHSANLEAHLSGYLDGSYSRSVVRDLSFQIMSLKNKLEITTKIIGHRDWQKSELERKIKQLDAEYSLIIQDKDKELQRLKEEMDIVIKLKDNRIRHLERWYAPIVRIRNFIMRKI